MFARTSWDEDSHLDRFFEGHLQVFRDGHIVRVAPRRGERSVRVGDASVLSVSAQDNIKFHVDTPQTMSWGWRRHAKYDVEIDDLELREAETDNGGTLLLAVPEGIHAGVRAKKRP